nr:MAG TPA: hypothetical protein [Caudoviricetes sp.]
MFIQSLCFNHLYIAKSLEITRIMREFNLLLFSTKCAFRSFHSLI